MISTELRIWARRIVDKAYNEATDSHEVPATDWADRIIDSVGAIPEPKPRIKSFGEKPLLPGIEYLPIERPNCLGDVTDGDASQMVTEMPKMCQSFECQRWIGQQPVAPVLVERNGFMCCSACGASYGKA